MRDEETLREVSGIEGEPNEVGYEGWEDGGYREVL